MRRRVNSRWKAALSKPLSATSSLIRVLARPRFCFLIATLASVRLAKLISCGCALWHKIPIGSPLPSATSITLLPFPILVRPTPSPLFLTARTSRPEKGPPIQFFPSGQDWRAGCAIPNPRLQLATTRQIYASRWLANHPRRVNQPMRSRYLVHIKCRSNICGYRCAVAHVPVLVVAKAVPALPTARHSNRVDSYCQLF